MPEPQQENSTRGGGKWAGRLILVVAAAIVVAFLVGWFLNLDVLTISDVTAPIPDETADPEGEL